MKLPFLWITLASFGLAVSPLLAQNQSAINIDIGANTTGTPSATFGAAAKQPGFWNSAVPAGCPVQPVALLDTSGAPSGVVLSWTTCPNLIYRDSQGVWPVDVARLLDDSTETTNLTGNGTEMVLTGLPSGDYQVYTYVLDPFGFSWINVRINTAQMPVHSTSFTGTTSIIFEEALTHTVHQVTLQPNQDLVIQTTLGHIDFAEVVNGIQIVPGHGEPGAAFYFASKNSLGVRAMTYFKGTSSVSGNSLTLGARWIPRHQTAFFLVSPAIGSGNGIMPPGSQGTFWLGQPFGRFNRAGEIMNSGQFGFVELDLDLGAIPMASGPVSIQAGETWYWQCWYRDQNPHNTSNLSKPKALTFFP